MDKEIKKHLNNPNLRGMVTTKEMLSFPKVAKGVKAEYDERYQGYTWQVKADDGNIINYGERDYGEGHRLLTAHSKTGRDERGQLRREFNDRNFHNPAMSIIPQNQNYTWRVKTNDENTLIYGSREYIRNDETINRLLTTYSQTEYGERINNSGNGQTKSALPPLFKDSDFRRPTNNEIIPQKNKSALEKASRLLVETPSAEAAPTWSNHCADNSDELFKCDKAPSTTAKKIIAQQDKSTKDFKSKFKEFNTKKSKEEAQEKAMELLAKIKQSGDIESLTPQEKAVLKKYFAEKVEQLKSKDAATINKHLKQTIEEFVEQTQSDSSLVFQTKV